MAPTSETAQHLSIVEMYNRRGANYGAGGNKMQALDNAELESLLPYFLARLLRSIAGHPRIVDFGCGTGHNAVKLLGIRGANIVGLDISKDD